MRNSSRVLIIIVIVFVVALFMYWYFDPERRCLRDGCRWIDGACRMNVVCPRPFYDIGPARNADGDYVYECGVPEVISKRIGSTFVSSNGNPVIKTLNTKLDHFGSSAEVVDFWKKLGFDEADIGPGGGPGGNCPSADCASGRGWFYSASDGKVCRFSLTGEHEYGAHLAIQDPEGRIDIDSFQELGNCSKVCSDDSCTVDMVSNPAKSFYIRV